MNRKRWGVEMMKLKLVLLVLSALALGLVTGYAGRGMLLRNVIAEGVLQVQTHPDGDTPQFPLGYYVLSRVYIDGAKPDLVGKPVVAIGKLLVLTDETTLGFPCINDHHIRIKQL
jgi:hypothetical protein